jgi:hypothetical protein
VKFERKSDVSLDFLFFEKLLNFKNVEEEKENFGGLVKF